MSLRSKLANALHWLADSVEGLDLRAKREQEQATMETLARIWQSADERFAMMELEVERRSRLGLLQAKVPDRWRACYYMKQGYRAASGDSTVTQHWNGGPPSHEGAECPVCKKPLQLLWDIDCGSLRSSMQEPDLFGDLERLPLYYCCRRPEPTMYQVASSSRIRTIRPQLVADEESPFEDFPEYFQRKPLRLDPIPHELANLVVIAYELATDWLSAQELARLNDYFGTVWSRGSWSQFGGVPVMLQGHQGIHCPNLDCPTRSIGHPLVGDKQGLQMKELAVIIPEDHFEMESNCAQIVFHLCWKCHTIHGSYRCD